MSRTLAFDEFWSLGISSASAHHGIAYHPCCDVWTTKSAKTKRNSHPRKLQWKQIISSLGKNIEDKKQALLIKMTEDSWQIPVVLNEACQIRPQLTIQPQSAFKLHNPHQAPQGLRHSLAPQDFTHPGQDCFFRDAQGKLYNN
jgi:hypothetical protein